MTGRVRVHKNVICIIGMHRSGTSMVARLLNQCGLNLGPEERLLGPNADNAMGHFEHTGFIEIDDALLKHFGGSWDNPPILNSGWENDATLGELVAKAKKLIDTFTNSAPWGWKEPRTTFLLPFWQTLLPDLRYVVCVRNPLEVARSLAERNGTSIPEGAHLWSQYTRAAIQNTEGWPRILTFYEDFFRDPLDEINRVVGFCRLHRVDDPSKVQGIISGEHRHQTSGTVELLSEGSVPFEYKLLYLGLRSLALEERCTMGIDDTTSAFVPNGIGNFLSMIDELHDQEKTLQLETALCAKEYQLRELGVRMRGELREKNQLILQLQDHNVRLQTFADAVRKTVVYRLYRRIIRPLKG
jgi:hypothetical protein